MLFLTLPRHAVNEEEEFDKVNKGKSELGLMDVMSEVRVS